MRQQTSPAIVLRRTNYGEADRIVTFLTPSGKISAMVKGVRRSKSKLAGGIELFSENTITFLQTKGDLHRIISSRLDTYWEGIVGDLPRMMFGYEAMKLLSSILENEADGSYYELLRQTLAALSDSEMPRDAIEVWFYARLLKIQGHEPNLTHDPKGTLLSSDSLYSFSVNDMCFFTSNSGEYRAEHIKLLRLALGHQVSVMKQINGAGLISSQLVALCRQLSTIHLS
jgi:DNA repair protein RecO (recombination protein O)